MKNRSQGTGIRVLITSTLPDTVNHNKNIRSYLAYGFEEILGKAQLFSVPFEIAPDVIRKQKPAIIVAIGSLAVDNTDLRALRQAADCCDATLAFWLHDDPYEFDYAFRAYEIADIIFSNDLGTVPYYRHSHVYHLPLAGCPKTHLRKLLPVEEHLTDLFFCGVGYPNRVELLRKLSNLVKKHSVAVLGSHWPRDILFAKNQRLTPAEMADYAQKSLLTLNLGRDFNIANSHFVLPPSTPGPRTFEVALSGSAQAFFVDSLEIEHYFDGEEELILFDDFRDLSDIFARIQEEPEFFIRIAQRAQDRALHEHCYKHRAARILEYCEAA